MKKFLLMVALMIALMLILSVSALASELMPVPNANIGTAATPMIIVGVLTFCAAEVFKVFRVDTNKIPVINICMGIAGGLICYFSGIMPNGTPELLISAMVYCISAACGAGGLYDAVHLKKVK